MQAKSRRIPTLIAILALVIGVGGGIALAEYSLRLLSRPHSEYQPRDVRVTNRTASMASVSWVTAAATAGEVKYWIQGQSPGAVADDDRQGSSASKVKLLTHYITLTDLLPETNYAFTIKSDDKDYDNKGTPYVFSTFAPKPLAQIFPVYGTAALPEGDPAENAIVFLKVEGSDPLSTTIKPSGNWLIPLNIARNSETGDPLQDVEGKRIDIFIQAKPEQITQAVTTADQAHPLPAITLGKQYDFRTTAIAQQNNQQDILGSTNSQNNPSEAVVIIQPEQAQPLSSDRPLIRGKGISGEQVNILLESSAQKGIVTVDGRGNWSWTPPRKLSPGTHTVTIETRDSKGNPVTLTRNFVVLKSGSQVLGEATPTATLAPTLVVTPTLTPTVTPILTLTPTPVFEIPTPTATEAGGIRSGTATPTLFLLGAGFILLALGFTPVLRKY